LHALERGFRRVVERANQDAPDEAAAELTTVYMTEFEPLERYLLGRSPQAVRPLEIRFNQLRGDLTTGLKGDDAQARVGAIVGDVEKLLDQLQVRPVGAFGPAFVASLVTIVREGIEVILVIAMLLAVVSKASRRPTDAAIDGSDGAGLSHEAGDRAKRAIWWGVGLAGVASILTAVVLNALVVSASGQFREILEGVVLMTASAILFYVSYWLVAQAESKRWLDFLKRQANQGLALGGRGALAVTAFLAVYREGAETALMFQAMVGAEARTRAGLLGVTAGLALGFILLAVIAYLIRATSVRLPLQSFFKLSGMFLFALAIAFAGNGVFELQNAGILITTNVSWIGRGLPWLGIYPNLQVLSVQALLLAGAILAWVVVPKPAAKPKPAPVSGMSLAAKRS
jgi:high-affinity iron transporter